MKVRILFADREPLNLVEFLENQKWLNLANFDYHNTSDEVFLMIAYYVSKAKQA